METINTMTAYVAMGGEQVDTLPGGGFHAV